jgi:hypothetical protein
MHKMTTEEHIYGVVLDTNKEMNKDEILKECKREWLRTREITGDFEDEDGDIRCYGNREIDLELLYKSNEEVENYVRFKKKHLEKLLKNKVEIYCNYMDQGFDKITYTNPTKEKYDDFIRDVLWADKEEEYMECFAGETPYVREKEYNKLI